VWRALETLSRLRTRRNMADAFSELL